jgi:ATP-dependent helicase/nuclease subunit A
MEAPDQDARERAIHNQTHNLLVQAGAGSGKTTALMDRLGRILSEPDASLSRIVAITFTEKAAEELKARLRTACDARLAETGDPAWSGHRQALETAHIGTIHGFCAHLLRVHALRIGLDPYFTVLDDAQASLLLADSTREHLLERLRAGSAGTAALVAALGLGGLVSAVIQTAGLRGRPELAALPATEEDVRARWGAVLEGQAARHLARLRTDPDVADAVELLRSVQPFHQGDKLAALRAEVLGSLEKVLSPTAPLEEAAVWAMAIAGLRAPGSIGAAKNWPEGTVPQVRSAIETIRSAASGIRGVGGADDCVEASAAALTARFCTVLPGALQAYAEAKAEQGALDFDDLLILARDLLREHPDVRRAEQERFDHILVDEFQDTDPIQREVIWYLAEEGAPSTSAGEGELKPGKLFVVGDAKQSIYLFRGADVTVYDRTLQEFKADVGCDTLLLTANFRSQPRLVSFLNEVFSCPEVMGPDHEARRAFEAVYERLEPTRDAPPDGPDVTMILAVGQDEPIDDLRTRAADRIARYIAEAVDTGSITVAETGDDGVETWRPATWKDFMILLPTMTGVQIYERALRDYRVPYYVVAGKGFYGRPEILDITALLRVLDDPNDDLALARVLRSPCFCVSDEGLYWLARENGLAAGLAELRGGAAVRDSLPREAGVGRLSSGRANGIAAEAAPTPQHRHTAARPRPGELLGNLSPADLERSRRAAETLADLRSLRDRVSLSELIARALDATALPAVVAARFDGQRAYANLQKLVDVARAFEARESASLSRFIEYAETLRTEEIREGEAPAAEEQGDTVSLMTIHKAKGLQSPVVVVADLGGGRGRGRSGPVVVHPEGGPVVVGEDESGKRVLPAIGEAAKADRADRETAEAKRLLYVALTRAQDRLVVSAPVKLKKDGSPPADVYLDALISALGEEVLDGQPPAPTGESGDWTCEVVLAEEEQGSAATAPREAPLLRRHSAEIDALQPLPGGDPEAEEQILRRLGPVPPDLASRGRFTATELAAYLRCPREYELRYVRQLAARRPPAGPLAEGKLTPFERGNVVHRALQLLGRGPATDLRRLVETAMRELGVAGHDAQEAESILETLVRFTKSDTWKQIEAARELRSEVPVVARFGAGLLEGQVDALFRDAGNRLHLLDYKTGRAGDAGSQADHVFQVGVYAAALLACIGEPLASVSVHYLADGRRLEVDPAMAAEEARERAEAAMAGIRGGAFPGAEERGCERCPYAWVCRPEGG